MQHSLRRWSLPTLEVITHGTPVEALSLLRNRGLAAKEILLDLAGGCFRQLGLSATLNR